MKQGGAHGGGGRGRAGAAPGLAGSGAYGGRRAEGVRAQRAAGAAAAKQVAAARLARAVEDVPRGCGAPGVRVCLARGSGGIEAHRSWHGRLHSKGPTSLTLAWKVKRVAAWTSKVH